MSDQRDEKLAGYYAAADSWAQDRATAQDRSRGLAWIIAAIAVAVALIEAIALVLLIPLKREVPYTLLVDRQTGFVEALKPLEQRTITPDAALTRSFLVQYVIARESFGIDTLQQNYRKVALWSAGDARSRYLAEMRAGNPESPLASLPRRTSVDVRVRSVSSLSADTALVRFDTVRADSGSSRQMVENWAAVIKYGFSDARMSADDRLINPLGFQVTRYRKSAETLSVVEQRATVQNGASRALP